MIGTIGNPRGERGQALIIMVMAMTVMFLIGAIAVDVGLWLSERRGAQADADFVALSGAWELLDPAATEADARDAVDAALAANDEQLNADLIGEADVSLEEERCVSVDVGHDSRPLFFAIFGVGSPEIGAHAKACTGAANAPGNLVPFQIDDNPGDCFTADEEPIFTSMCPIELGAQGGTSGRGMLDLQAPEDYCSHSPGSGDIEDLIVSSAPGICLINTVDDCDPNNNGPWYDCVAIQTGNPQKVIDGVEARVTADGGCDGPDAGDVDDFFETINLVFDPDNNPLTAIYEPRDCDESTPGKQISPRLVSLIVLEEPPPNQTGPTGYPIIAFAGFYLAGCASETVVVEDEDDLDRYCTLAGTGAPGQAVVYGRFVRIVFAGGGIGEPTDQTTAFGIALIE